MWFLQADTMVGILLICLVMMVSNRIKQFPAFGRLILLNVMCTAFIAWVSLRLLGFYLVYIAVIFGISRLIVRTKAQGAKRALFAFGVFACLFPLLLVRLWTSAEIFVVIGLAFAVLRGIDALIYTYYTEKNLRPLVFYNFMMLIPTFTAGPVFRYRDFDQAVLKFLPIHIVDFAEALKRIIRGLFKTMVIGGVLMQIFTHFLEETAIYTLPISVLLVVCGYLILYFNLAGYADIAIALGRFCGFIVPENFKKPWRAASFSQFWRSWHATVSDWIRENVQVLLHNKRMSKSRAALTAMVVMMLMSLWHGFSIQIIVMGFLLATLMAIESFLGLTSPKRVWTVTRVIRCVVINFLFGINTLLFFTDVQNVFAIVRGLVRL